MTNDAQVWDVAAFATLRLSVSTGVAEAKQAIAEARRAVSDLEQEATAVVRLRHQALESCRREEGANCDVQARRYEQAVRAQQVIRKLAREAEQMMHTRGRAIADHEERASASLTSLRNHFDQSPRHVATQGAIGTFSPTTTSGASGASGGSGSGGSGSGGSGAGGSGAGGSGLPLPIGTHMMPLDELPIEDDIFASQPNGDSDLATFVQAATIFRDVVMPGIARGMTRDDFESADNAAGRFVGYDRQAGAYDLYWSPGAVVVSRSPDGSYTWTNGRHRALAARVVGIRRLPVHVQ